MEKEEKFRQIMGKIEQIKFDIEDLERECDYGDDMFSQLDRLWRRITLECIDENREFLPEA